MTSKEQLAAIREDQDAVDREMARVRSRHAKGRPVLSKQAAGELMARRAAEYSVQLATMDAMPPEIRALVKLFDRIYAAATRYQRTCAAAAIELEQYGYTSGADDGHA
jgi:hypothetical protein